VRLLLHNGEKIYIKRILETTGNQAQDKSTAINLQTTMDFQENASNQSFI